MSKPRVVSAAALDSYRVSWVIILLVVALSATGAFAQLAGKGTILGTVTDPTGAVVPGATIVATNIAMEKTATETGAFSLPLDPGLYNLSATAHGFKTTTAKSVNVNALETV